MRLALDVSMVPSQIAGAGRYILELARRLPERGVNATLVTRRHDSERWQHWSPRAEISSIVPDHRVARLAYEAWRLGTSAPARGVDVWHGPHYTMPHRRSTATVVTIHDLTFFTNPEWHVRSKVQFFQRAINYAAHHADALISVSDFTSRQLDEFIPDHAPVIVAPHGVDLSTFNPDGSHDDEILRTFGLPLGVPFIFFVGTFEPRKGLDLLLRAFADVAAQFSEVELWLAGQIGWGLEEFDREVDDHPASTRIRRMGFVDEALLPTLLRRSRCVAYPSRGEGFGLPVLEALASGALVVTTRDTVMSEVADGTAELARVGDAKDLARALSRQLNLGDAERDLAAQRGRARAELFTWDASMDKHLMAYDEARKRS